MSTEELRTALVDHLVGRSDPSKDSEELKAARQRFKDDPQCMRGVDVAARDAAVAKCLALAPTTREARKDALDDMIWEIWSATTDIKSDMGHVRGGGVMHDGTVELSWIVNVPQRWGVYNTVRLTGVFADDAERVARALALLKIDLVHTLIECAGVSPFA